MPGFTWLRRIRDNRVRRRLLRDGDYAEDIVDEVHRHWVVYALPATEMCGVLALLVLIFAASGNGGPFFFLLIVALSTHAAWKALVEFMDVFVVTNMRVFRITGVVSSKHATTPLARILDITVDQPFLGLVLGYGNFTFESAAQEQGLRDIPYVGRPLERDLTIQRLVQQIGLRSAKPAKGKVTKS